MELDATVGQTELIKDLFEGVIDDNALAKLSSEELDAINKMLTEGGYQNGCKN